MDELDTLYDYLLQQLRTEDHIRLLMAVDFELMTRAGDNGVDNQDYVLRMRREFGCQYSTLSHWLQIRDLFREADSISMSLKSTNILTRSVLERFYELDTSGDSQDGSDIETLRSE